MDVSTKGDFIFATVTEKHEICLLATTTKDYPSQPGLDITASPSTSPKVTLPNT